MTISTALLFLSGWIELSILSKATVLVALGLTIAWMAGRVRASVRHVVLAATFLTLLVLPLVVATSPERTFELAAPVGPSPLPASAAVATPPSNPGLGAVTSAEWSMPSFSMLFRW